MAWQPFDSHHDRWWTRSQANARLLVMGLLAGLVALTWPSPTTGPVIEVKIITAAKKQAPKLIRPALVWSGPKSLLIHAGCRRITTVNAWSRLWKDHHGSLVAPALPRVDFEKRMVVAIFGGLTINGGGIEAISITESADSITFLYAMKHVHQEGPGDVTAPFGLFLLPKSTKALVLEENAEQRQGRPPVWQVRARMEAPAGIVRFKSDQVAGLSLRTLIFDGVQLLDQRPAVPQRLHIPNLNNQRSVAEFRSEVQALQKGIVGNQYQLAVLLDELGLVEDQRKRESAAWQSYYDYTRARLTARIAGLHEINRQLGEMCKKFPDCDPEIHQGWQIVTAQRFSSRDASQWAGKARAGLERLVKQHGGPGWQRAVAAERASLTGLKWAPFLDPQFVSANLNRAQLASLTNDLMNVDEKTATRALWRLAGSPEHSVRFMRERLRNLVRPDASPERIKRLIVDLDSRKFIVRERASHELENLSRHAVAHLQATLDRQPSLEVRLRVEQIQRRIKIRGGVRPDELLQIRAVETMEMIGLPRAETTLKDWASGNPTFLVTQRAKAVLGRLAAERGLADLEPR